MSSTPPSSSGVNSQPTASGENSKTMSVIFDILNNPVSRGSDQNITITVSDAVSNESIADATITGKLLYPGDNYVKDLAELRTLTDSLYSIGQLEKMVMLENSQ